MPQPFWNWGGGPGVGPRKSEHLRGEGRGDGAPVSRVERRGGREVVLAPLAREPAVLAALLEDLVLPLAQELLHGLEAARLEDEAGEHGVLAVGPARRRLDEELVDDLALRRVDGQQVGADALDDLVPRLEARRVVLLRGSNRE